MTQAQTDIGSQARQKQFIIPFEIKSRLYDWLFQVQEPLDIDDEPSVVTPLLGDRFAVNKTSPSLNVSYAIEFRENYLLRVIDCPFPIVEAYYSKSNSLFIESPNFLYSFDERGLLHQVPEEETDDEVWEEMVNVDSFQELEFFIDSEEPTRRLVGIKLHVGNRKLASEEFDTVIEIDKSIGSQKLEGISKTNINDNLDCFKEDPTSMPLVVVACKDLLLYPENIHLKGLLPQNGKIGWGSVVYADNRLVAIYRN